VYSAREYTTDGSTSNFDIFMLDGATQTPVRLVSAVTNDVHPVWSPDGTRVAYLAMDGKNGDIVVLDLGARTATKINRNLIQNVAQNVLFWTAPNAICYATSGSGGVTGWVIDPASGNAVRVNNFAFGGVAVTAGDLAGGQVSISRDGANVARINPSRGRIVCTAANGAPLGEVTFGEFSGQLNSFSKVILGPWSPDARSLLVFETGSQKIYVADVKSGLLRFLVDGRNAAWSADGSRVLYTSPIGGAQLVDNGQTKTVQSSDVCVVAATGGQPGRLTQKICLSESVAVCAVNGKPGEVDFGGAPSTGATPVAATEGGTAPPPQFTADSGGNLGLVADFEASGGFIMLAKSGSGWGVAAANRITPVNGKKYEITTFTLQNGKFGEANKELGSTLDDRKYQPKFDPETFNAITNAEERGKTVGHDLAANARVLYMGEPKAHKGSDKRLVIYVVEQGGNWQTFAAMYRANGGGWKQEMSTALLSGSGKPPTVNAGLRDMEGDGHRELLVSHHIPTNDGWRDNLKVFRMADE
jgi:hypothetical protein